MDMIIKDIKGVASTNTHFRKVLLTGKHVQIVVMSIPPGGEIGEEIHEDNDQVLVCTGGDGIVVLEGVEAEFTGHDVVLVKAGVKHNFINTGKTDMKIVTMYAPPHHPENTVHATKEDADKAEVDEHSH